MHQKRNPDMLELIRAKTGSVYGALMAILTILKAQPSAYNRDLQEDKIHIFTAADTINPSLDITAAIVTNTTFDTRHIEAGLDQGFLDATGLAEYLVKRGIPFRKAHGIVGSLVASCEQQGKKLADLELDEFKAACELIESDVYNNLSASGLVSKYLTEGSASPGQVTRQIQYWKEQLKSQ